MMSEKCHISLLEAIEFHSAEFHRSKDEWSLKMLKRLLNVLSEREGVDYPNYLALLKKADRQV